MPKLSFETFVDADRSVKLEILSTDGIVLKTQQIQLKKGLSGNETELRVDKSSECSVHKINGKIRLGKKRRPIVQS